MALALAALLTAGVWGANYWAVGEAASNAVASDPRNNGIIISAHYAYYLDPTTIVVDLRKAEDVAPIDLFRSLFQVAAALKERTAEHVVLARRSHAVFVMKGSDFHELGASFDSGENTIYLIRTWPQNLYRPDGRPAFGNWEGGWLGVMSHQMDDAATAGRQWAEGAESL